MSFEIPASIEPQVHKYADAMNVSTEEAILQLIQSGLRATTVQDHQTTDLSTEEWDRLRAIPGFVFLEGLPDAVAQEIEASANQARQERLISRG